MEPTQSRESPAWLGLARGVQAGVIGGVVMLGFEMLASIFRGRVWWESANILGSTFYGVRAFHTRAGMATVAGAALHLVITGSIGLGFAAALGSRLSRRWLMIAGIAAGIGWFYLGDALFWQRVNPLVPLYEPEPATLFAWALMGMCLGGITLAREPAATQVLESEPASANGLENAVE